MQLHVIKGIPGSLGPRGCLGVCSGDLKTARLVVSEIPPSLVGFGIQRQTVALDELCLSPQNRVRHRTLVPQVPCWHVRFGGNPRKSWFPKACLAYDLSMNMSPHLMVDSRRISRSRKLQVTRLRMRHVVSFTLQHQKKFLPDLELTVNG